MSEWIKIRVKDFYKDAIGETEYTYVTREVYEALANTFRKEAHAEEMRDLRHTTADGYVEGETEDLMMDTGESLENMVIRQMELETLQKAMQSLTEVQRERLHLYFFEEMTTREIAEKNSVSQNVVWKSIQGAINDLKNFFE
jgi:RNA polymerase sigma-70 factor (ECF subfamily)